MTLAEALEQVELEPGRTYQCSVRGMNVMLRVAPVGEKLLLSKPLCEEDIMLDPWCELPQPRWGTTLKARPGPKLLPDAPQIPHDEDGANDL
jgi:hypothetical protein